MIMTLRASDLRALLSFVDSHQWNDPVLEFRTVEEFGMKKDENGKEVPFSFTRVYVVVKHSLSSVEYACFGISNICGFHFVGDSDA